MEHLRDWFSKCRSPPHDPEVLRERILRNSVLKGKLVETDPELAEAVKEDDPDVLDELLLECQRHRNILRCQKDNVLQHHDSVPDDVVRPFEAEVPTYQVKRYVVVEVNGHLLEALLDSTAQSTIMSKSYAKRCGLLGLVDGNYKGVIHGVRSDILGRVHSTVLKFGDKVYEGSFLVLDSDSPNVDFVFGLDMLRKHQCIIDFEVRALYVGFREVSVPLFEDKDTALEEHAKLASISETKETTKTESRMVTFEDKVNDLCSLGYGYEREVIVKVLQENNEEMIETLEVLRLRRLNDLNMMIKAGIDTQSNCSDCDFELF